MATKYAWSHDGEVYYGSFDSLREAFDDAAMDRPERSVWIGEVYHPAAEDYIDADLVIDHITQQDEYSLDAADGWPGATSSQRHELTAELQRVVGDWLDRHKLRGGFFLVRDAKRYMLDEGELVEVKRYD